MFQKLFAKIGVTLVGAAIVGGAGIAAGITYENTVPWGLRAQRDRVEASIPDKLKKAKADQLEADRLVLNGWRARLTQCQGEQRRQSDAVAETLDAAQEHITHSRDAAYALGRQAGLAQCRRTSNEQSGASAGDPVPDAGVVRDDVDLQSLLGGAAYRPSPR